MPRGRNVFEQLDDVFQGNFMLSLDRLMSSKGEQFGLVVNLEV